MGIGIGYHYGQKKKRDFKKQKERYNRIISTIEKAGVQV
ncbi:hypothetical protein P278_12260 [Zhouia amylolytica AD3]|uniref:Uncharacterized protein n=1 Tax=Zhouia amylolytica AD3 TaxID=1286632 RepID=W2UNH7_9FLAO|nr:hypothetical protein P278_12260 [Zhouia amylolytica AD3]